MAYSVKITRVAGDATNLLYHWESTTGSSGALLLEVPTRTFRPADPGGDPVGEMLLRVGDADVTNPDPSTVHDFLTAASSVMRKWKGGQPPDSANLYFG
jgi:hypothetical protein